MLAGRLPFCFNELCALRAPPELLPRRKEGLEKASYFKFFFFFHSKQKAGLPPARAPPVMRGRGRGASPALPRGLGGVLVCSSPACSSAPARSPKSPLLGSASTQPWKTKWQEIRSGVLVAWGHPGSAFTHLSLPQPGSSWALMGIWDRRRQPPLHLQKPPALELPISHCAMGSASRREHVLNEVLIHPGYGASG